MIKELFLDLKDYDESMRVYRRRAVRAIVRKGDKYLIIHGKYGDHKFPGGGMKEQEELLDTLARELLEETGFVLKPDSAKDYILVHEKRRGIFNDFLDMDSWYYFCDIEDFIFEQKLDDYEKEYGYQVEWMDLSEALLKNLAVVKKDSIPWIDREILVMKELIAMEEKKD